MGQRALDHLERRAGLLGLCGATVDRRKLWATKVNGTGPQNYLRLGHLGYTKGGWTGLYRR